MFDAAHVDVETRSVANLPKVGAHRYAEDPTTEIILGRYRFGKGPLRAWVGDVLPEDLATHIAAGGRIAGHNQQFERAVINARSGAAITIKQQDCTMSRAVALGLPASLDALGPALRCKITKDREGHRLTLQMCRPRTLEPLTWWDDAPRIQRLGLYCDTDVDSECEIDGYLPALSARERQVWELDQSINDRGVCIDLPMVRQAQAVVAAASKRADKEIWRLTNGAVKRCTEVAKIVEWIRDQGVPCESIAEPEHEDLIIGADLFDKPLVEQVVRLRAASAKALKFQAMLDCVCRDGRIRDSLKYHATIQGRWAGSGVQFHNMKRIDTDEESAMVRHTVDLLHRDMKPEDVVDALAFLYEAPLEALSLCTRACVVAASGAKLLGGDFSNIEGRINAWIAGEHWKLRAFEAFDRGEGPDIYKVTASDVAGVPVDQVTKAQRQNEGKVPELACGYQGSLGAFNKMGAKFGLRLPAWRVREIVSGWRAANPAIVNSWLELQNAAIEAVGAPGCVVSVLGGKVQYQCVKDFLFCKLPSGRVISYASPSLAWKTKTIIIDGDEVELNRYTVSYWGQHKGWRQLDLYGGMQCAHVVSGTARDVLVAAMFRLEAAGYPIVLTVHDETLSEVDEGFGSAAAYKEILLQKPAWLADVPIAATAWEGDRYDK